MGLGLLYTFRCVSMPDQLIPNDLLGSEALRLGQDMKNAREEELVLHARALVNMGQPLDLPLPHTIEFGLASEPDANVSALRAIVAARAFGGKLLKCTNCFESLADNEALIASGGESKLVLKGISEEQLNHALDYMYTGQTSIDKDNVYSLLETAHKLQLPGLKVLCSHILQLKDMCSAAHVSKVLAAAHENEVPNLKESCFALIARETKAVIESQSFEELPRELVSECITRDDLTIDETLLFLAVMRWGAKEKQRLLAEYASSVEAAQEVGAGAEAGGKAPPPRAPRPPPDMSDALKGVIEGVRFALISPENLR